MENNDNKYSYEDCIKSSTKYFNGDDLAASTFVNKYALKDESENYLELNPDDMHRRLAREIYKIEKDKFKNPYSEDFLYDCFKGFERIIPQGSPMYGIGNSKYVSLSNCFVVESPVDSYSGICYSDQQIVQIAKRRGGKGLDISNLRPSGAPVTNAAGTSSGIIPFMERFSNTVKEVGQCLHEDTQVLTERGMIPIKDVVVGDNVWTNVKWVKVNNVVKNKKVCKKIKTNNGKEIICSEDHVFHSKNGELKVKDMSVGDSVSIIASEEDVKDNKNNEYLSSEIVENISIYDNNKEQNVYDLCLEKEHFFYANGFYVHNSGRRGALLISISVHHPEIMNFINSKIDLSKITGANISIRITDEFMNAVMSNSDYNLRWPVESTDPKISTYISANKVWDAIVKNSWLAGEPGILFWDNIINESPADCYSDLGFKTLSTNPCLTGDTLVYVADGRGNVSIKELAEKGLDVPVFCYDDKGKVVIRTMRNPRLTGKGKKIYKVTLEDGVCIKATSNHKIRLSNGKYKEVKDLKNGDSINIYYSNGDEPIDCNPVEKKLTYTVSDSIIRSEKYSKESLEIIEKSYDQGYKVFYNGGDIQVKKTCEICGNEFKVGYFEREISFCGHECADKYSEKICIANNKKCDDEGSGDYFYKVDYLEECGYEDVYNGTVDEFHNFFIGGFEGKTDLGKDKQIYINNMQCGEIPLCAYDSCRLLCINLFNYVANKFKKDAYFDFESFSKDCKIAQRIQDDIIDLEILAVNRIIEKVKLDPEEDYLKVCELRLWKNIAEKAKNGRRTGTGLTGLGDTLASLGLRYGSEESIEVTEEIYKCLKLSCYKSSVEMSKEIGPFPIWNNNREKDNPFLLRIKSEDDKLYNDMIKYGRRNISLLTSAPTGSSSIMTGTTSGIEPCFLTSYTRRKKILGADKSNADYVDPNGDSWENFDVFHKGFSQWMEVSGSNNIEDSPYHMATTKDIDWVSSIDIQAAAQRHIDHSISKTCNIPNDASIDVVDNVLKRAYSKNLKGITIYRDGTRSGVLVSNKDENNKSLVKTNAPKRPKQLECDIYHTTSRGIQYFVIIGLWESGEPYEIFAGKDGSLNRNLKKGYIHKIKRGKYSLIDSDNNVVSENISEYISDEQEAITRLISSSLRHGCDVNHVVEQLEKTNGDMLSFAKAVSRCLKKYIKDGTGISGEECPECNGQLRRIEGCATCVSCGWSKCG